MNIFIGIDPSINSTGVTIQKYNEDDKLVKQYFYIIKPNKLTKQEENLNIKNFEYIIYEKYDTSKYKEDNHLSEYYKTLNLINISNTIFLLIKKYVNNKDNIIIVMEGISYGSSNKTKSIYDLAGLNYLIRYLIIKNEHIKLMICPPSEIKKFASGKGNSNKDILIEAFLILFPEYNQIKKIDDLVDSYFMCKYAKLHN